MEIILLKTNSKEWVKLWDWVAENPLNAGLEDPKEALNNGEVWEYVGSFRQAKRVLHELRHRNHPKTNSIQRLTVAATSDITDDDIATERKL